MMKRIWPLFFVSFFATHADVPAALKGAWEVRTVYADKANASSVQNCGKCELHQHLVFSSEEAWLLKGRCSKPTYELKPVKFSSLPVKAGDYDLKIAGDEEVQAVHIRCGDPKTDFVPDESGAGVAMNEVWLALRANKELVGGLGITGVYTATASDLNAKPSFDCTKARAKTDKEICGDPILASRDRVLGEAYKTVLAGNKGKCLAAIKREQQEWVKKRDRCGKDHSCLAFEILNRTSTVLDGCPSP